MSRDWQMYVRDMIHCAEKVSRYVGEMSQEEFCADEKTYDAILRNLEIIGEGAKHVPVEIRQTSPDVEWQKISGFRDVIAHAYFGIDDDILWDIIVSKVPALLVQLKTLSIED